MPSRVCTPTRRTSRGRRSSSANGRGSWASASLIEGEEDHVARLVRAFHGPLEDPATGSAYLASKKGEGKWGFEIVRGVEMGRRSEIGVKVEVEEGGH